MTNDTQLEDKNDAPATQGGSCLGEAVLIVVLGVLVFLVSVAYLVATTKGLL